MIDYQEARRLFADFPSEMFVVTYRPTSPDTGPVHRQRAALTGAVLVDYILSTDVIEKIEVL